MQTFVQIKELESQLLIERKLARQHVDTRIAENQLQQQQEANVQSQIPSSPARILSEKRDNHEEFKEIGNVIRPPVFESVPPTDIFKCNSALKDKENISKLSNEDSLPNKPSRASLCNAVNRIPISPTTRRNSLIPVPYTRTLPPPLPLVMNTANLSPPPLLTPMPVEVGNSGHEPRNTRKINSILRRSLQKKVIIRSPMHQNIRRAGGTTDKLRTSIGGSGRKARRGTIGEPARAEKLMLQKLKQKEKGWNNGTAVKNIC